MSFDVIRGEGFVKFKITGAKEIQMAIDAMRRELPTVKTNIQKDGAVFFVYKAKSRVHIIKGDLGRSIKVDSATPQAAIVSANMPYAATEEARPGKRRIAPGTPHAYMHPSAIETGQILPTYIKKRFDEFFARHKTTAPV